MDTTALSPETETVSPSPAPRLTLSGISKSFPGVRALHDVGLSLYPGQVTALIGENGAGKSTLVKILTGIYQPDSGEIGIDGEAVELSSAHKAFEHGITAIHQETVLFDDLSVAENIFLGHAPRTRLGTIDWKTMRADANEVLTTMRAGHINADARLRDLGIANKHLVAVARAMSIDAQIVIMDEPTAALSAKEIEELFLLIEFLKSDGKAVLFISHKFDEIFRIADRYTVFRDGEMVGEGLLADTGQGEIVQMMVGRAVDQIFPRREADIGANVLSVRNLSHPTEFDDISFDLHKGEILGFYGLVGAGRSEVMQAIFGITRTSCGEISLEGKTIAPRSAADAIDAGIVYVPEERGKQGVVIGMPIFKNVSLPSLKRTSSSGVLRLKQEFELARAYTERLDLRAASLSQDVGTLSGGNQQKIVIAKWLATAPKVIILDEPTKGIDIGSKAAVHGFMAELVAEGLSVIMVSSELPEILGMSDRVVVMREGRVADIFDNKELDAVRLVEVGGRDFGMRALFSNREVWLAAAILAMIGLVSSRFSGFAQPGNLAQLFNDTSLLMILALGQMVVILTRSIDLSMAANLCFTGMVVAMLNAAFPAIPIPLLIVVALSVGLLLGAINGLLVWKLDIPSIVVTLGTLTIYRGATFVLSGGAWVNADQMSPAFIGFQRAQLLGIPVLSWVAIVVIAVFFVVMTRTALGRSIYAVGVNPTASVYAGIDVGRTKFIAFCISGLVAGLAGYLWISRYVIASVEVANGYELNIIAACVIGGISIAGGIGSVGGAVLGALFLGIIASALPVVNISPFWQMAISGSAIILAVVLNARTERKQGRIILKKAETA